MRLVRKGEKLKEVRWATSNVIIHEVQEGCTDGNVVIIGAGNTLDIDENGEIIWHDPCMFWQDYETFKPETKVLVFYYTHDCKGLDAAGRDIVRWLNTNFNERKVFFSGDKGRWNCSSKFSNS